MTRLETYRGKRDLDKTREPAGESTGATAGHRYVLHKHDASQLHYDLRLEQDGVLRSWALPKGPSLKVGEKRLAIEVDDHPLEYGDFEGVIPEQAYGGGTVMLWDRGEWRHTNNKAGQIDFELHGEKLKGAWTLVRISGKANQAKNRKGRNKNQNWLLIKRHDAEDLKAHAESLKALDNHSVLSGRSMDRIAADGNENADVGDDETQAGSLPNLAVLDAIRKQSLPTTVQPQLATLVQAAPPGDNWLHEFKFDGYRLLARLQNNQVQLLTRNHKDWAARFPKLTQAIAQLPVDEALLDGEAVALGSDGISDFGHLQEALSAGRTDNVVFQLFDLLHLNGHNLMPAPQSQRKQALSQLLLHAGYDGQDNNATLRYTEHLQGRGQTFHEQTCRLGLEGIISKRADSAYAEHRGNNWLKVKCVHDDEFIVAGFTDPKGSRSGFGALLIGAYDNAGKLIYCGRVGTGFSDRQLKKLHAILQKAERDTSPFANSVPDTRSTHWVRPQVVIEVQYTQRTRDGRLRHPAFKGQREDKDAQDISLPHERPAPRRTHKTSQRKASRQHTGARVAGVRLTHPQRLLYPEQQITKLDLAQHYEAIQDWIIPALVDRPLSLLRCPQGWNEDCFFQKHMGEALPEHMPRLTISEKQAQRDYVYVRSIKDLVGLVQAGTLELHVWGSRVDDLERPDRLVFDIDPAPDVPWKQTLHVARSLRDRLEHLGLASFVRTTGGKGLHLVVPLTRKVEWADAKAFAHAVSRRHARADPAHLTTNMAKDKRRGRIFIDYLRNARGATAIASYSTRAHEGAPIAVPIRWDELSPKLAPDHYHINNLRHRLAALNEDPWAGFAAAKRPLTKKMFHAVRLD